MVKSYAEIESIVRDALPECLWMHTLNTIDAASRLAEIHSLDMGKARLAALLHDYAKAWQDLQTESQKLGIEPNAIEIEEPLLLHGQVAARLARRDFGIDDPEVLSAIEKHTFGDRNMSALDKVLYISDMVESDRVYPERWELLALAESDLDEGFRACLSHKLRYVIKNRCKLHPDTVEVWNRCLTTINTIQE